MDDKIDLRENELELCRFKLKKGSRLRNDYTGFADIQTEFDTVNLATSTWAGDEVQSFSKPALRLFAKEAFQNSLKNIWDVSFCMECLNSDTMHRQIIEAYIANRLDIPAQGITNVQIFEYLVLILRRIQTGEGAARSGNRGKRFSIELD